MLSNVIDIISLLDKGIFEEEVHSKNEAEAFAYKVQKRLINSLFSKYDSGKDLASTIIIRLTVIDSLYATNAGYSYFSIEEMAEKMLDFSTEKDLANYFYSIALGADDSKKIFSESYGIKKNLNEGSKQISLLSKYAYYLLLQDSEAYKLGFPIYDSLAMKTYPKLCSLLGIKAKSNTVISSNICDYIAGLEELRSLIFSANKNYNLQDFDLLDAYLWRIGKMEEGNFSLLLDRKNYTQFIKNLDLEGSKYSSIDFNKAVYERSTYIGIDAIKGINDNVLSSLYEHWLEFYVNRNKENNNKINNIIMAEKKIASSGEYIITKHETGSIEVHRVYDNTKGALREIAEKIGFEYDPNWNTRTFGAKLIDELNK